MSEPQITAPFSEFIAPDPILQEKWNSIIGLDDAKKRVLYSFESAVFPDRLKGWFANNYNSGADFLSDLDAKGKLLITGPSGTGKTQFVYGLADALSRLLGTKTHLIVADLVRSKYEGESARYISYTFNYARRKAEETGDYYLLFYDEGDSVLGDRDNEQMHDTIKEAVNRFLQELEMTDPVEKVFVAVCSNLGQLLDAACERRFDIQERFELPTTPLRFEFLTGYLAHFDISEDAVRELANSTDGYNYGQLKHLVLNSVRTAAIEKRKLNASDLSVTLKKMDDLMTKTPPLRYDQ